MKALDLVSVRYDPICKAPTHQLSSAKYHTRLAYTTVHPTREVFQYGAVLLATGREEDCMRAIEVLNSVVGLQDM